MNIFTFQRARVCAVFAVGCLLHVNALSLHAQKTTSARGIDWVTDPAALLELLKQRDADLQNRTLDVVQLWTERVSPRAQLNARRFNAKRFGQDLPPLPKDDEIPDDFDQPHRVRHALTVREPEVTLERLGDEEIMLHQEYVALQNAGHRWSSAGGVERSYSPETKSLHINKINPGGVLRSYQWMFEWCCGYGIAKWMNAIESAHVEGQRLVVKGRLQLMDYDDSTIDLELDHDYVIRRAVITVPVQRGEGSNQFVVITSGTIKPEGCPAVAKQGQYKRVLQNPGKEDRVYKQYQVEFVDISAPLTDQQYKDQIKIDPPEGTSTVDFRPKKN